MTDMLDVVFSSLGRYTAASKRSEEHLIPAWIREAAPSEPTRAQMAWLLFALFVLAPLSTIVMPLLPMRDPAAGIEANWVFLVFYNGFGFVFVYAAMLSWALDVFDLPLSRAVVVFGVIVPALVCDVTFYLLGLIIWPFPAVALLGCIAGCGVQALTVLLCLSPEVRAKHSKLQLVFGLVASQLPVLAILPYLLVLAIYARSKESWLQVLVNFSFPLIRWCMMTVIRRMLTSFHPRTAAMLAFPFNVLHTLFLACTFPFVNTVLIYVLSLVADTVGEVWHFFQIKRKIEELRRAGVLSAQAAAVRNSQVLPSPPVPRRARAEGEKETTDGDTTDTAETQPQQQHALQIADTAAIVHTSEVHADDPRVMRLWLSFVSLSSESLAELFGPPIMVVYLTIATKTYNKGLWFIWDRVGDAEFNQACIYAAITWVVQLVVHSASTIVASRMFLCSTSRVLWAAFQRHRMQLILTFGIVTTVTGSCVALKHNGLLF